MSFFQSFKTLEEKTRTLSWIRNHIYKQIEEHKESFDPDNIRDFVDLYLQAKETDSDKIVYNGDYFLYFSNARRPSGSRLYSKTIAIPGYRSWRHAGRRGRTGRRRHVVKGV